MKPLPLEQLIGGPLRALVLAQGIAAQTTAQFLAEVGFSPDARGRRPPTARTFEFTYVHPVPDPENPGEVVNTPVRVRAPLLALTSVPNLRIAEGTVTFHADVVDTQPAPEPPRGFAIGRQPTSTLFAPPLQFMAAYVPAPNANDEPGSRGNLSVSVRVSREPLGEGLNRIITLLQDAITSQPESE
jgi:hypothetical protein